MELGTNPNAVTVAELEQVVRTFPAILQGLQDSYADLEERARHVEEELCRKVAELDALHHHLEAVLEALPCGVLVRDADGALLEANPAALALLESTLDELRVRAAGDALHGTTAEDGSVVYHAPSGTERLLRTVVSPIIDSNGAPVGTVEILDDQTERAAMTARLHAADKMASLGTMAGGIAHEIRNPLNAIKGFAALLARRQDLDEEARRWCGLIVDASSEANSIIESLLTLGSPEGLRPQQLDAHAFLQEVCELAAPAVDATVEVRFVAERATFRADHIKLRQVLRNLVANAIRATAESDRERVVELALREAEGGTQLTVDDSGPGIPAEQRARVFDPFFTGHADGTGLGLALAHTLVRLHGGTIQVSPSPSYLGGAQFQVFIPDSSAPTSSAQPQTPVR